MNLYLKNRFYICLGACIIIFLFAFSYPTLLNFGWAAIIVLGLLVVVDYIILWNSSKDIASSRQVNQKLSLGDKQKINYTLDNESPYNLDF